MMKARKMTVILVVLAILCGMVIGVLAVDDSNAASTMSADNHFAYANAPEGLYMFIYHGSAPYFGLEIDTSECIINRLYVYNAEDDSLAMVSDQAITAYTYTQTALYYVTEEQRLYKTDYSGTNHEFLYQSVQGNIDNLDSYFDALYFIENHTSIKLLDVASKEIQELWTYENLGWVIMLNATQLIATTIGDIDYLYDLSTNTATCISANEAANLITVAVKGAASDNARSYSPIADYSNAVFTQENDVTFPLEDYPAVTCGDYSQRFDIVQSWFHNNGLAGCSTQNCTRYCGSRQCMGFAKYVHDAYAHVEGNISGDLNKDGVVDDTDYWYANKGWEDRTCITKFAPPVTAFENNVIPENVVIDTSLEEKVFDGDEALIENFFETLKTGAYVRYGKYHTSKQPNGDPTPQDGCHSIVFIARDDQGIWVYECNQDDACGVFIQYYPYEKLTKYKFILNYVNHDFTDTKVPYDTDYHKVGCKNCGGYVLKKHYYTASCANSSQHRRTHCCDNTWYLENHTGSVEYYERSSALHGVEYSCCSGYVTAPHVFATVNDQLQCALCGYANNSILSIEGEEIN